jgi:uncharacterized small protein (DUF1192 family)
MRVVLTWGPAGSTIRGMDLDELIPPPRKDTPLAALIAEDIDRLSLDELDARIAALETEIARTRAKRQGAGVFRAAADSLFKR